MSDLTIKHERPKDEKVINSIACCNGKFKLICDK